MKLPLVTDKQARTLVSRHGSPLYVYSSEVITARYKALDAAIRYPKKKIYYACKANSNIAILKLLKKLGSSIECVSRGEVERALSAGFPASRISYTCSNIPRGELMWVMQKGVSVHIDSLTQLQWWGEMKPGSEVSLRINRGYGAGATSHLITGGPESKFGIYFTDILKALTIAKKYKLTVVGLQQHIGSSILTPATFVKAMNLLLRSAKDFPDLKYMDFGGGLGIPYHPDQKPLDIPKLGKAMSDTFSKFCKQYDRDLEMRLEPGRFVVAEAGALLAKVVDIKKTPRHAFVGLNTGFNHLTRPALYGSYHHIFNMTHPNAPQKAVTVVGNVCESSDVFAAKRKLPMPRLGDILLIADAGAYGFVMSSDYNLRPKPKEILI